MIAKGWPDDCSVCHRQYPKKAKEEKEGSSLFRVGRQVAWLWVPWFAERSAATTCEAPTQLRSPTFAVVIDKAITACQNSGYDPKDHFAGITKMVDLGSGARREIEDIGLTRYACYLIAQNGDPAKEQIAFAQTYFAASVSRKSPACGTAPLRRG